MTAATTAQARGYRQELAWRKTHGLLPGIGATMVLADPRGKRVGSGGSTILALDAAARRLGTRRGRHGPGTRRVAIIHCGGDSRRLPAFSAHGKVFAPVSCPLGDDECVLTKTIADLCSIVPRPGQTIIASGDMMLGLAGHAIDLTGGDVTVLTTPLPFERASRHGVFAVTGSRITSALQKPTRAEARAAGALLAGNRALTDTGVIALTASAAQRLCQTTRPLLPALKRAALPHIDLYDHIMRAMVLGIGARAYRQPYEQRGVWHDAFGQLRQALRGLGRRTRARASLQLHAQVLPHSPFDHAGTTRQYLELLTRGSSSARTVQATLHSRAGTIRSRGAYAIVDCDLDTARLGGDNLCVGLGMLGRSIALPRGCCCFEVPLRDGQAVRVLHGIDDDFKTPFGSGGTIGGASFDRFTRQHGLDPQMLLDPTEREYSLWTARLWPVLRRGVDASRFLQWMLTPRARPPRAWLAAPRVSVSQLATLCDGHAMLAHHLACVEYGLAAALPSDIATNPHGSPLAAHARLTRDDALAQLSGGYSQQFARATLPLTKARLVMAGSDLSRRHGSTKTADGLQAAAMALVGRAVSVSEPARGRTRGRGRRLRAAIPAGTTVEAASPVRIDFAGGWSDTPPICIEHGGTVLNAAVLLNGECPIRATATLTTEPVIRIRSVDQGCRCAIRDTATALRFDDPNRWDALPKAAIALTGIVPIGTPSTQSLAALLRAFGGGIDLTINSTVPKGSGLGTSSILGATILAAIHTLCHGDTPPLPALIQQTSQLEQLISTRGGWQDQVGGLYGGVKISRTTPGAEQSPAVMPITLTARTERALADRGVLFYTGIQRMARGLLETVVGNYLLGEPGRLRAIPELKACAERAAVALGKGDFDAFAECINENRRLKLIMDPASVTPQVQRLIDPLLPHLAAWCPCGAGGGGFVFLLAKSAPAAKRVRSIAVSAATSVGPLTLTSTGLRIHRST